MSYNANIIVILICVLYYLCCLSALENEPSSNVQNACSVTQYRSLCIHSLAPFSSMAKRNPTLWARAGVSVTISEAKSVDEYLLKLKNGTSMRGTNSVALADCIECSGDAIDNLHRTLGVLRKLSAEGSSTQMGDVITWISAALTDEGTCLDGFDGENGRDVDLLRNRVTNLTYITSNALALVNKLATAGPGDESPLNPEN